MATRKQSRRPRKPRAATADVLAGPTPTRVRSKWQPFYRRLLELRNHLQRRQDDLSKDALEENPSFSTHMADAGTDNFDRDVALGMLSSEQDAVYEIDQALDRIRNGTYGRCEMTGKPIEPDRLEAIPWTRFSAAAERQLEKQGALKTARLGPRQAVTRVAPGSGPEEGGG